MTVAYVALGSNLGNSKRLVQDAMDRLERLSSQPILRSALWLSSPVDCPPGSGDFVNAVIRLNPKAASPEELLAALQEIEREFGRTPKKVLNEARPLDLDLIHWEGQTRATPLLTLPHPRAHLRRFVLAPLAEIAPDLVLPGQAMTARELLSNLQSDEKIQRFEPAP